jgi:ATPase subunit of ABC transporter with duplicated ATPase domains
MSFHTPILLNNIGHFFHQTPCFEDFAAAIFSGDRIGIVGDNGAGKSTFLRPLFGEADILRTGDWQVTPIANIGYLDQYYNTIDLNQSVEDSIRLVQPQWDKATVHRHLHDFLFRSQNARLALGATLSGGEKARLCLAQIAARTPALLLLDEVTNNLDLKTKQHMIQVLRDFPGGMIIASHDEAFLQSININTRYNVLNGKLVGQ